MKGVGSAQLLEKLGRELLMPWRKPNLSCSLVLWKKFKALCGLEAERPNFMRGHTWRGDQGCTILVIQSRPLMYQVTIAGGDMTR